LYMELHPCRCGETRGPQRHALVSRGDDLVAAYEDACARCGRTRRFDFVLDPELVPADQFGGSRPSTIVDAGQYLPAADAAAQQVPGNAKRLAGEDRQRASWFMTRAVNAMGEVLKFIPPGADQVPPAAFFTEHGRAICAREPGRFRKVRLEAVLGAYQQ